jgi:hypothetical protein
MPKIPQLPSDTSAEPNDLLIIEDNTTATTRKIKVSDFIKDGGIASTKLGASEIITGSDLNNLGDKIRFGYGNGMISAPSTVTNGYLLNIPHSTTPTSYNRQIWSALNYDSIFTRTEDNNVWSSWTPIISIWRSYAPNWTNLTVGNAVNTAYYTQTGKTVTVRGYLEFGTTTALTGSIEMSLPVNSQTRTSPSTPIGNARLIDISATTSYHGTVLHTSSSTQVTFACFNSSATYLTTNTLSSSVPFTWTTGDFISYFFTYECV